jgi:hypothetical protein
VKAIREIILKKVVKRLAHNAVSATTATLLIVFI